ncbi:uncharacterized protein Z518_01999 [Rhinocladiella mackenziei CBS 650.93]|uniref:Major facilitator superfamily (MFS) profile domain-containing protein n=1 Tax=Rhinocladiella mackenziei CBS 650.93 TaxID=1442369 RepID=A0A0D2IVU6_9EURO|nr:uncharacterized protein Z518_01999 [Rhinocladiella mackenziei CBS 650.93]KIX07346.1 hypothetical protein Z518_01999 [Rhinocladiella mackenziei CBS 650.93]
MGGEAVPVVDDIPAGISNGKTEPIFTRLRKFTPRLVFMMFFLSIAAFNFGYDQGNFSGLQALDSFEKRFGRYNEKKERYQLPSYLQSLMTSTPYLGKLLGTWTCGPLSERLGRKKMMAIIVLISYVGVVLEITASTGAQFTVGRIVCFYMAGFTVQVAPVYLAECAPPDLRGFIGSQVQFQINFSIMIAAIVNFGVSHVHSSIQWRITVMIQLLMPTLIALSYPFAVESPRWLIGRGRKEEAVRSLGLLRKKDVPVELLEQEVTFLSTLSNNEGKGSWKEVFTGINRRRTAIACFVMFGQQITGQVFASQYGTIFYKTQGIANPFLMQMISTICGLCCMFVTSLIIDSFGRRVILLTGGMGQAIFMLCLGGVGLIKNPGSSVKNLMVAFLILDGVSYNISWAPLSYLTVSEVSNFRVRDKTAMLALSISIVTVFVTSFTLPYLMNEGYGNLGPKVGFIYGSLALTMVTAAYFVVPELKGRTLDEIDELFERRVGARKFRSAYVESTRFEGEVRPNPVKGGEEVLETEQIETIKR